MNNTPTKPYIPVACYGRFSSDMQRLSSIEDQQRNCLNAANEKGWTVLEDCKFADIGVSGQTLHDRDEFARLIETATSGRAPFKRIVVDDTSRFARNLSDLLLIVDKILHAGVSLYFVEQALDSDDISFRSLLVTYGIRDEQHSVSLGNKVRRGMIGRVLKGFIATGIPYGYRSVPILDETRKGRGGYPAIESVDLSICEDEAETIRRMFQMCVDGIGYTGIARILQSEGVPASRALSSGNPGHWHGQTVKRMLQNPKYKGLYVWGKNMTRINPNTHRKDTVRRPQSEWENIANEKWRIVSDELWEAAQVALKKRSQIARPTLGGLSRWPQAADYIFSGLLTCASCGGRLSIFSTRPVSNRYICQNALAWAGCQRRDSIHQGALQPRLLGALRSAAGDVLKAALVRVILEAESAELERRLRSPSLESLETERATVKDTLDNLYQRKPSTSHSTIFRENVDVLEARYSQIEEALAAARKNKRSLVGELHAENAAKMLVQEFRRDLEGHASEIKNKIRLRLRPIYVSWELKGEERMALLHFAIDFYLTHSKETVAIPIKIVISTEYKLDRLKPYTDETLTQLCSGSEPLTPVQIERALGIGRSSVARWCQQGLQHHWAMIPSARNKKGVIHILPIHLKEFLDGRKASASETVLFPSDEYPPKPEVHVRRRKSAKQREQRLALAA